MRRTTKKIAEVFEIANRLLYEKRKNYGLFEYDRKNQQKEINKLPKDEKESIIKTKKTINLSCLYLI